VQRWARSACEPSGSHSKATGFAGDTYIPMQQCVLTAWSGCAAHTWRPSIVCPTASETSLAFGMRTAIGATARRLELAGPLDQLGSTSRLLKKSAEELLVFVCFA